MTESGRQVFVECGGCGSYHRKDWYGDCRDDSERFTMDYLEDNGLVDEFETNIITIEEQMEEERNGDTD